MIDQHKNENTLIYAALLLLLGILAVCLFILCCTPPFSNDALIHHLQIPKLYLQHCGIYEIPQLIFSYYPMNLDLLYLAALSAGNDILPKFIHAAFAFATALLIYRYLKRKISRLYGLLGTIFFLSTPIIARLTSEVYVDLGIVFFSTASLLFLFKWTENEYRTKYIVLAGIFCGLAVGTKYNGLLILLLLTFFIPVLYVRGHIQTLGSSSAALKAAVLFVFIVLFTASPLLIRNNVWTGNPIYPLYNGFFNPTANSASPSALSGKNAGKTDLPALRGVFAKREFLYKENTLQLLLLPVRIFFEGKDDDPRYFDGRLNPFLLLLSMFAFLRINSLSCTQVRLEIITLTLFCLLYFFIAFNTTVLRIRYLTPMVPFLVILSMYGLNHIESTVKKYNIPHTLVSTGWLLIAFLILYPNGEYLRHRFVQMTPLTYISGKLTRDEYISMRRPEYPVMVYANNHLPESAKILCIFLGWRGYYLNREHIFDHPYNTKMLLARLTEPDETNEKIQHFFRQNQISHLLIRQDLFKQYIGREETMQIKWNRLKTNHLHHLASYLNYSLYEIVQ